jgi:hypothetical protein
MDLTEIPCESVKWILHGIKMDLKLIQCKSVSTVPINKLVVLSQEEKQIRLHFCCRPRISCL